MPKHKAGDDDDDEANKGPAGNYIMFKAEGDLYQTRTLWEKAISCYTRVGRSLLTLKLSSSMSRRQPPSALHFHFASFHFPNETFYYLELI